jgi:hypothetical protein
MHNDQAQITIEQPFQPEIPRPRFARGMLRRERTDEESRLETKRPSISGSLGVGEEASRSSICAKTIGHACS